MLRRWCRGASGCEESRMGRSDGGKTQALADESAAAQRNTRVERVINHSLDQSVEAYTPAYRCPTL